MAGNTRQNRRRPRGLSTLAGLVPALWLKADSFAFTDDGVTIAGENQSIQKWFDYSGNGRYAEQPSSTYRPTWHEGIFNQFPGLRFASDYLQRYNISFSNIFSIFMIGCTRPTSNTSLPYGDSFFSAIAYDGVNPDYNNKGIGIRTYSVDFTNNASWYVRTPYTTGTPPNANKISIFGASQGAVGKIYYIDGTSTTTNVTRDQLTLTDFNIANRTHVLRNPGLYGGYPNNLNIGELLYFDKEVTEDEKNKIFSYFVYKYLPDPPNVIATMGGSSAVVTWQAVPLATEYNVSYKQASSNDWILWETTTNLTSTIVMLEANTDYHFLVRSVWSIA